MRTTSRVPMMVPDAAMALLGVWAAETRVVTNNAM